MPHGEPRAGQTTEDGARIDAGLVKRETRGSGWVRAVIVARSATWRPEIKRFAETLERADGGEVPELRAPGRGHGDETPEQAAAKDEVLASQAVAM